MLSSNRGWSPSLAEVRSIAAALVQQVDSSLVVISARSQHDSDFVELLITDMARRYEPGRLLISIDRDVTEETFRKNVEQAVRLYLTH